MNWEVTMVKGKSVLWLLVVALLIMVPLLAACAAPAPTPPPAPPAPPAEEVPPPPATTPTAIPHPLEGRADCLMCHTSGDLAIPADHAGRANDTCTTCHQSA